MPFLKSLLVLFLTSSLCVRAQSQPSIQFCFPFDGDAWDRSGHGYFASPINGPAYVADRFGRPDKAIMLLAGQYLKINKSIPDQSRFTLMTWIRLADAETVNALLVDARQGMQGNLLWEMSGQFIHIQCVKGAESLNQTADLTGTPAGDGGWHHVIWQAGGNLHKIWLDGVKLATFQAAGHNLGEHAARARIGASHSPFDSSGATYQTRASFDDFRLYDDTLSEAQIRSYYQRASTLAPGLPVVDQERFICDSLSNYYVLQTGIRGRAYRWTDNAGTVLSSDSMFGYRPLPGRIDTLTLVVTDPMVCDPFTQRFILHYSPTEFTLNQATFQRHCQSDSVSLTVDPPGPYRWSTGTSDRQLPVTQSGSYTVTRQDPGCPARTKTIPVEITPWVDPRYLPQATGLCLGTPTLACNAPDSVQILWTRPSGATATACLLTPESEGTYRARYTTPKGCTHTEEVQVVGLTQEHNRFFIRDADGNRLDEGTYFAFLPTQLEAVPEHDVPGYVWQIQTDTLSAATLPISITQAGPITVSLTRPGRLCVSDETRALTLIPILMPNLVTANDDGKNDTWPLLPANQNTSAHIQLYDRWGHQTYDGGALGAPALKSMEPGTYFYKAELHALGVTRNFKGWVELVR